MANISVTWQNAVHILHHPLAAPVLEKKPHLLTKNMGDISGEKVTRMDPLEKTPPSLNQKYGRHFWRESHENGPFRKKKPIS